LGTVLARISDISSSAKQTVDINDLDDLASDAELQGQFRGYLCPVNDIQDEGELVIDVLDEWGVPKTKIKKLRDLFGDKLEKASPHPEAARSALHTLFAEKDSWGDYTDDYEDKMWYCTRRLFGTTIIFPLLAVLAFHFAYRFQPLLFIGLLCAGVAGSCVSVLAKMPALDVSLSSELDAYGRRVLNRIGIGVVASLIGCAFLGWFPIAIQNQTFADALNACTFASPTADTGINTLLLLGVPMLLAFSERTLTSFEHRVLGNPNRQEKR
jgi:hypothetical protein